jgi:ATP-dependent helicase/DNAse subunit B
MSSNIFKDKYSAVWVSHSSISDYLRCPRAYYLKNVYRDLKTNHKISILQPSLLLGQIVHEVIEGLSLVPVLERSQIPLTEKFLKRWMEIKNKDLIFVSKDHEESFKNRGLQMMQRIMDHPGPISRKAIKLRQDLPYYWLSEEENIILCGKIDWFEYLEEKDAVRIIDFKTGKSDEDSSSLQLPIYNLLSVNVQKRPVLGFQYWYLEKDDEPLDVDVPDLTTSKENILEIARKINLARKLDRFICKSKDGCLACRPYEAVIAGRAKFIGVHGYNQDIYVL